MADDKKLTTRAADFSAWYNEVVLRAELADYSPVRGCMVIRPDGYGIWERMQRALDDMFKATGHQNAYFPLLIPESFLKKEAEHVEGFAPEAAVVTHGGGKKLEEPLVIRPTSETIIYSMFAKWVQSYRDLPLLDQPVGERRALGDAHAPVPAHAGVPLAGRAHGARDARRGRRRSAPNARRVPRLHGRLDGDARHHRTEDGLREVRRRASHVLVRGDDAGQQGAAGGHVAQPRAELRQGVRPEFQTEAGDKEFAWNTSWGVSTRLIGGLVMTHGDDTGLRMPPLLAPTELVIVPIYRTRRGAGEVLEAADRIAALARRVGAARA